MTIKETLVQSGHVEATSYVGSEKSIMADKLRAQNSELFMRQKTLACKNGADKITLPHTHTHMYNMVKVPGQPTWL